MASAGSITTAMPSNKRLVPDFGVRASPCSDEIIPTGTRLVRIYNRATTSSHHSRTSLDFNPNPIDPDDPAIRARFTSTVLDPYACLYVAEQGSPVPSEEPDPAVAVWEMMEYEGLGYEPGKGYYYNSTLIPPGLAFRYLETTQPLRIINIRNQKEAGAFEANWRDGLSGNDYAVTRAWARYIRQEVPAADGLRYTSTRLGPYHNSAIVLFEKLPHVTSRTAGSHHRKIRPIGNPSDLTDPKNAEAITRAFAANGMVYVP